MEIVIKTKVPMSVIESVFITALEGGSNYWYYLSDDSIKTIRDAVSKKDEPYLAIAMFKAITEKNVEVPIYDIETDEQIGSISMKTMAERLQKLADNDGLNWCLNAELNEQGDAETSDVVFQFLSMGEHVYG